MPKGSDRNVRHRPSGPVNWKGNIMYRSYKAFSGRIYRFIIWFIYPAAVVAGLFLIRFLTGGEGDDGFAFYVSIALLDVCLSAVEIFSDYFFLSGINKKKAGTMEMLKGSTNGDKIIIKAFCGDFIRRAAILIFAYGTNLVMLISDNKDFFREMSAEVAGDFIFQIVLHMLATYIISEIGIFAARTSGVFWFTFAFGYFLPLLTTLSNLLFDTLAEFMSYKLQTIVFVFIAVAFTVFSVWFVKKRRRESYYDVRPETGV